MWAGRSTSQLSQTRTRAHSSPSSKLSRSSWSMMSVLVLFFCMFLVVVDIEVVTSMSLDRLAIDRNNELRSDKQTDSNDKKNSELIVEDLELEALPAGGETDMYVLLPAGSSSERESVDKNIIESDEAESQNGAETGSDMIMVESNDVPVIQVANLLPAKLDEQKDKVDTEKIDIVKVDQEKANEEEPTISAEKDVEPLKQVFKNDKDIEDMAFESDDDKDKDSSEDLATQIAGAEKGESEEEPESMIDMLADVAEEVEKEIETELIEEEPDTVANKFVDSKDVEKEKWEATVEKLEEKGSEKNDVNDTDMELEAAAVMEEILPEEVVEAMAIADETNTSSEETEDEEKNDVKFPNIVEANKITEKDTIVEKEPIQNTEKESTEQNKIELNEVPKLEENAKPSLEENKMEGTLNQKEENQKMEEMDKVENLAAEIPEPQEMNTVEDLPAENSNLEELDTVEDLKAENSILEELEAETPKPQEMDKIEDLESENIKPPEMVKVEDFKTEKPDQDEVLKAEDSKAEVLKNEEVDELETHMDTITKEENKDQSIETSQKVESSNSEQSLQLEKEQTNNISTEEHKDLDQQNISNEIENTAVKEQVTAEETSDKSLESMQSGIQTNKVEGTDSLENTPAHSDGDLDETILDTTMTKDDLQGPANETPLEIQEVPIKNENSKEEGEENEPIVNNAVEIKPIELMTIGENVEDNVETSKPMKPIQIEESIIHNENDNAEDDNKTVTNIEKEMESLNKPIENSSHPQKFVEQAAQAVMPTVETTMTSTILHIPTLQQPQNQQQQQQQNEDEQHNEMLASENKGPNGQIPSAVVEIAEMTVESIAQKPQNVISATQDTVFNYVNATNAILVPLGQMEQQKQQMQHETESDNEASFSSQLRRYDGAQVWRIVVQNDRDRRLADELQTKYDGQLWKEVKQEVDYLLKPQVLASAERHIRAANLSRIVLIDNLQQVIEVENPPLDEFADADNEKGHRLTWHAYHRLADIHEFFDYLAKTYPEICAVETIGYSVQKRPLKVLKISNGNAGNPGVWIDGGMHAREWISPASVTYIANQLAEGWEELPSHMQSINWYIHAVANPDGYEYTHTTDRLWRKNMRSHGRQCPGVDLNRNFGYKWGGKGTSANPCSQTYRGSKAFSEPETFYISKFISGFPRDTFQAFLSFHSYGQYILYPWGYDYLLTNDRSDLDRVARAAATTITRSTGVKYTVGPSAVTLYPAAGGSDDWAKGIANIKYTYTIEMGDSGRYGFILPASHIETNGKDAFTFIQTVARAISHDVRKRTIKLK